MKATTMITRRTILATTSLAPLAACAGSSSATTVTQAVLADLQLVVSAAQASLPQLSSATGLSTAAASAIAKALTDIAAAGSLVTAVTTNAAAQTPAVQIANDTSALQSILATIGNPPAWLKTLVQALVTLAPLIQIGVGILLAASPVAGGMSPDDARAALRNIAGPK